MSPKGGFQVINRIGERGGIGYLGIAKGGRRKGYFRLSLGIGINRGNVVVSPENLYNRPACGSKTYAFF